MMAQEQLIKPYTEEWTRSFNSIRRYLSKVLAGIDHRIHHVGSTAVPGLAAKDIIDLDVAYREPTDFHEIQIRLAAAGYLHRGDQGIPGREVFRWIGKERSHPLDSIAQHLYVCHTENAELQRHLAFRDYLRTHPDARAAYQVLKQQIAAQAGQRKKQYALLKEEQARSFVADILAKT